MIYYKVIEDYSKESPWILMVHGFTHNCTYFREQINYFRKDYKIVAVDLRGHGNSRNMSGPFGIEEYADDIDKVLKHLGITGTIYWGTHTGAAIGLVLALRNPEMFFPLILEGTFLPGYFMPGTAELIDNIKTTAKTDGVLTAMENWFNSADWFAHIHKYPEKCRADEHKKMLNDFSGIPLLCELSPREVIKVSEKLRNIRQPVLVYNGIYDMEDFINAANHLEQNLPNVQREVISEAGGFPGWENYNDVNRVVQNYLDGLTG